jgi:hypothetical protein
MYNANNLNNLIMKTSNKTFRTKVFNWAHELVRSTGKSFAECLSKAWALYRLRKRMATEVVRTSFALSARKYGARKMQERQTIRPSLI